MLASIHQARADLFNLFESVLVLVEGGHSIYFGPTAQMVDYFNQLGQVCPLNANPADYIIDITSVDYDGLDAPNEGHRQQQQQMVQDLITHHQRISAESSSCSLADVYMSVGDADLFDALPSHVCIEAGTFMYNSSTYAQAVSSSPSSSSKRLSSETASVHWSEQFSTLCVHRLLPSLLRDSAYMYGGLVQTVCMSLVLMGVFYHLDDTSFSGIKARTGLLYIVLSVQACMHMVACLERFHQDLKIFDRELQDRMYSATIFFLAHCLCSLPHLLLQSVLYCVPMYLGPGLRPQMSSFCVFVAAVFCVNLCMSGLIWLISSRTRDLGAATFYAYTMYVFVALSCGFLVSLDEVPVYMRWIKYVSFLNYGYRILMLNEFTGRSFRILDLSMGPQMVSGEQMLELYGVQVHQEGIWWSSLLGSILVYHLLALYNLCTYRHQPFGSAPSRQMIKRSSASNTSSDNTYKKFTTGSNAGRAHALLSNGDDQTNSNTNSDNANSINTNRSRLESTDDTLRSSTSSNTSVEVENEEVAREVVDEEVSQLMIRNVHISVAQSDSWSLGSASTFTSSQSNSHSSSRSLSRSASNTASFPRQHTSSLSASSSPPLDRSAATISSAKADADQTAQKKCSVGANGSKSILQELSLEVSAGRLCAVMGGSGAGKSTLLHLLAGRLHFHDPSSAPTAASTATYETSTAEEKDVERGGLEAEVSSVSSPHSPLGTSLCSPSKTPPRLLKQSSSKRVFDQVVSANASSRHYEVSGSIFYKHAPVSSATLRSLVGYVQQFDAHVPLLTVEETLLFHAHLRLSPRQEHRTQAQFDVFVRDRVQEVLSLLRLQSCAHVYVGDRDMKGISGGEQRRLSVGIQLLSDPAICLLDEPTTGLDAFTARSVVHVLRDVARGHTSSHSASVSVQGRDRMRIVIASLHQPRYDIFACVDDVILLSRGRVLWAGDAKDMLKHFDHMGFTCPLRVNPADFILDLSSLDTSSAETEEESYLRINALATSFKHLSMRLLEQQRGGVRGCAEEKGRGLWLKTLSDSPSFTPPVSPQQLQLEVEAQQLSPSTPQELLRDSPTHATYTRMRPEALFQDAEATSSNAAVDTSPVTVEGTMRRGKALQAKQRLCKQCLPSTSQPFSATLPPTSFGHAGSNAPLTPLKQLQPQRALFKEHSLHFNQQVQLQQLGFNFKQKGAWTCYRLLVQRSYKNFLRQPHVCTALIVRTLFFCLILCAYYAPLDRSSSQQSIQNRVGLLYEFTALLSAGMLHCCTVLYIRERDVFYREYMDKIYSSYAFFASYLTLTLPITLVASCLFSLLCCLVIRIAAVSPDSSLFTALLRTSFVAFVYLSSGDALGVLFCSLFDSLNASMNAVSLAVSVFQLLAGFVALQTPYVLIVISYLSPLRWGAYLLMDLAFRHRSFDCAPSASSDEVCLSSGKDVLKLYDLDKLFPDQSVAQNVQVYYVLCTCALVFGWVLALCALRLKAYRLSH